MRLVLLNAESEPVSGVCVCVCACVCVCVDENIYMYTDKHIYMHINLFVCMNINTYYIWMSHVERMMYCV